MAKLTLTDIVTGYSAADKINTNNSLIEAAVEKQLSRDGTGPNTMGVNLDMNNNRVTNVANASGAQDAVTKTQLEAYAASSLTTVDASVVNYDQGGTGSVEGTVEGKLQESVSVKDFGVSGDGTDETSKVQSAIDHCEANSIGELKFIPKSISLGNKLIFAGGIKYTGDSRGKTKLIKHSSFNTNNATGDVMVVSKDWDTATSYNGAANGEIVDISFDEGNHSNTYGDAIALGHAANWVISRCSFFGMTFHGVDITGCKNITVRDCNYNGTVGQSYNGFQVDQAEANSIKGINADSTSSTNIKFINNYVAGASVDSLGPQSAAFHIHRSGNSNILIEGNYIENCDFLTQTDLASTGNIGITITNNFCLRGTIDGSTATAIKFRGEVEDVIISKNRTFGYNLDVSLDHPNTAGFHKDIIISDNVFSFPVNRAIFINQAYRVNVHDNSVQGVSGDMVDGAMAFLGVNYFHCHSNMIYDPDDEGIIVGNDAGGGVSSNGMVYSNTILNGSTGLLCTAAGVNNILFYSNRLLGTFATAESNIDQSLTNVRSLGIQAQEWTASLVEAGRTINAGAQATIAITITGAIQGDMLLVGYDKDTQGLQITGNMQTFQAGEIYLNNPTGGNITIAAGNWKVIAKSSRFIS